MSRAEMPRVCELCDLIADRSSPSSYFQDFDRSVASEAEKKRVWFAREREFQRLDDAAWEFLKDEALPYLSARDSKGPRLGAIDLDPQSGTRVQLPPRPWLF
jgi:hypothetical protein